MQNERYFVAAFNSMAHRITTKNAARLTKLLPICWSSKFAS
jgi:hypothetical protein